MPGPAVFFADQVAFAGIVDRPGQHRAGQLRHEEIILRPQRHQAGRQLCLRPGRQHNHRQMRRRLVDLDERLRALAIRQRQRHEHQAGVSGLQLGQTVRQPADTNHLKLLLAQQPQTLGLIADEQNFKGWV